MEMGRCNGRGVQVGSHDARASIILFGPKSKSCVFCWPAPGVRGGPVDPPHPGQQQPSILDRGLGLNSPQAHIFNFPIIPAFNQPYVVTSSCVCGRARSEWTHINPWRPPRTPTQTEPGSAGASPRVSTAMAAALATGGGPNGGGGTGGNNVGGRRGGVQTYDRLQYGDLISLYVEEKVGG